MTRTAATHQPINNDVLRICHVITDLEVGGVPLHLLRLARFLRDTGHEITVISLKPPGPVAKMLQTDGITVESCHVRSPLDWRVFDRLAGFISDFAPDVIHSLLFHANQAARVAALLCGFPRQRLVCEIQTVEIERGWHMWVDRFMHRFCALTIGNSPSVIEHLHNRAGISRDRLHFIPGGVDVERIASAAPLPRDELGVSDDEALLLWTGRLDPIKGLDTLIAAVDALRRVRPVRLLIAGDGPLRPRVEFDIVRQDLTGVVTLLGRRDDVPRLLKSADLFVFPSRTEGMPNALLEAMAAHLPVITTDVPGCRDVVQDEQTGIVVPVDDSTALTRAITRLIDHADFAAQLSARACHYVNKCHNMAHCAQQYADLFVRLATARV